MSLRFSSSGSRLIVSFRSSIENEGEENESGMRSGPQIRQPESDSIEACRRNTRLPFGISGKSSSIPIGSDVTS